MNFLFPRTMTTTTSITLFLADDHPLVLSGIRSALEPEKTIQLVGEARNGTEALNRIRDLRPLIALLDIQMPGLNGLEVARGIRREELATRIVLLTMHDDEELFNEAMDLDVRGYVLKDSVESDLVSALHSVAQGELYISPRLLTHVLKRKKSEDQLHTQVPGLDTLTGAERIVLQLVAESMTTVEISRKLNISQRTVSNHRTHICSKLGLTGSYSLLKFAIENRHSLS